jgi:hypothetical protein
MNLFINNLYIRTRRSVQKCYTLFVKKIPSIVFKKRIDRERHEEELIRLGKELMTEFQLNGYSDKEYKIARKIRYYMEKHGMMK